MPLTNTNRDEDKIYDKASNTDIGSLTLNTAEDEIENLIDGLIAICDSLDDQLTESLEELKASKE